MTNQEANKIIAEFMGFHFTREYISVDGVYKKGSSFIWLNHYTKSLDALVPVWEQLGCFDKDDYPKFLNGGTSIHNHYCIMLQENDSWGVKGHTGAFGKTIYEAAARATAKAIRKLKDER